jgi:hypothetical protein
MGGKNSFFVGYTNDDSKCLSIKTIGCCQKVGPLMLGVFALIIHVGRHDSQSSGGINF